METARPVAVIGVPGVKQTKQGKRLKPNFMPASWHMPVSFEPQIYAVAVKHTRYTKELIDAAGLFVVNFLEAEYRDVVEQLGGVSGRDCDKAALLGTKREDGTLEAAYMWYECRVVLSLAVGDHVLYLGEVTRSGYSYEPTSLLMEWDGVKGMGVWEWMSK